MTETSFIRVGVMSDADVLKESTMEVRKTGLMGEPHSVTDPRLGPPVLGEGLRCSACQTLECEGHAAHIDLEEYFYNPG